MVTAYPIAAKGKSVEICNAFVEGCGGKVVTGADRLLPGPAFFFGVDKSNLHLWREAKREPYRGYFYCDNSYFDSTRQKYFRVTKNRLQHTGYGTSDNRRFTMFGIEIKPWHERGDHIVVCPQSESFMKDIVGFNGDWTAETMGALKTLTKRPIRLREWNRDKAALAATLGDDLNDAYALVTWSSAAAVTALLEGVPVVASACATAGFSGRLFDLENLPRKDGRENWAGVLADQQFTLNEMRNGYAWKVLQHG